MRNQDIKTSVEHQFSQVAANYSVSKVHAAGEDLARMVDVAELGWKKSDEMGIKQTRSIAESRRKRKRELTQKMLKRAQLLRDQSQLVQVAVEKMDVEDAPFHDYVRSLRPELYRKRVSAQCETPSR